LITNYQNEMKRGLLMLALSDCSGGRIDGTQYILRYLARIATGDRRLYGGDAFSAVQASACRS